MPFLDFTAGEVLTDAAMDTTFRQTIMLFDTEADRDTALSAVLAEGLVSYTKDNKRIKKYNGSAWIDIGQDTVLTEGEEGQTVISNGSAGIVYENSISPLLLLGV